MQKPVNIIPIVESDFLIHARAMIQDRDKAVDLCSWAWISLDNNSNTDKLKELFAELINETHALKKQLRERGHSFEYQ